jgi:(4-O-methyl)-D-glucuronate---lignin esterase
MPSRFAHTIALTWLAIGCLRVCAQNPQANYDESQVGSYTLPDPLTFNNGQRLKSAHDWLRRRQEILGLFEQNVFGRNPTPASRTRFHHFDVDRNALGGRAIRKQITIHLTSLKTGPVETLLLYLPANARKPAPLILALNFMGNQSVIPDPGVKRGMIWGFNTHEKQEAQEDSRGKDPEFEIEKILAHGYGFATIYYQEIEPDFEGGYARGIRPLFRSPGQLEPAPDEWGAIGAWSYGLSRAMDYLERDSDVDGRHVGLMGFSRLGKTALWAGALDRRFAMVLSACPGEGGASLMRRNYGETIQNLVERFPYWFAGNFRKFAGKAEQLPVDAHELIALIAPRPVYVTAAEEDRWADPKGEFLALVAAGPVYELLGKKGLGTDQMPEINQPIMHTLGFHIRTGKHAVTDFDWDQFMTFAMMNMSVR